MSRSRRSGSFANSSAVPHRSRAWAKATSLARRHGQLGDLERRALPLPLEERRPGLAVGVDAPDAVVRRRHVEHDDVVGVVGEHRVQVAGVHRRRPPFDQRADLLSRRRSCGSFRSPVRLSRTGRLIGGTQGNRHEAAVLTVRTTRLDHGASADRTYRRGRPSITGAMAGPVRSTTMLGGPEDHVAQVGVLGVVVVDRVPPHRLDQLADLDRRRQRADARRRAAAGPPAGAAAGRSAGCRRPARARSGSSR